MSRSSTIISLGLVKPALLILLALFVYPLGFSLVTAFVAFPISRCLQDEAGLAGVAPRGILDWVARAASASAPSTAAPVPAIVIRLRPIGW